MYQMTTIDFFDKFNDVLAEVRFGKVHTHFIPDASYEVFTDVPSMAEGTTMLRVTDIIQFGDYFFIRTIDRNERITMVEAYKSQAKVWQVFKRTRKEVTL
jgi:hypothetical protein